MARKTKTFSGDFDYVLDLDNNREDVDPFWVKLQPLTGRELEQYERQTAQFTRGAQNFMAKLQKVRDDMISARVLEVHGYEIQISPEEILVPRTGRELVEMIKKAPANEIDLVLGEVETALRDHSKLEAGLRKK